MNNMKEQYLRRLYNCLKRMNTITAYDVVEATDQYAIVEFWVGKQVSQAKLVFGKKLTVIWEERK